MYTETGRETAARVADLLARSDDAWGNSVAPFDTDPLSVDPPGDRLPEGPLRPSGEEEWSGWLARLLGPSPEFVAELFDVPLDAGRGGQPRAAHTDHSPVRVGHWRDVTAAITAGTDDACRGSSRDSG